MSKKNTIEYKGYVGSIEFDADGNIFRGAVANLADKVEFAAETVQEIRTAFQDSVDAYLTDCERKGKKPEKVFSGKFVVRISPELHKSIAARAGEE